MPSRKEIAVFHKCLKKHNEGNNALKVLVVEREPTKTLRLSLNINPFEVMVTGEKPKEYRKPGKWIKSRLFNKDGSKKHYDFVEFTNGYGGHRPRFRAEFVTFYYAQRAYKKVYSNGLKVAVVKDDIVIELGKIDLITNYTI